MVSFQLPEIRIKLSDKVDPVIYRPRDAPALESPLHVTYSDNIDCSLLLKRVQDAGESLWTQEGQKTNVNVQRAFHDKLGVGNVTFTFCDDLLDSVFRLPWWEDWQKELAPIFQQLNIPQECVVRCLLARLPPGAVIPVHHDTGLWCTKTHRVHIPLITSPQTDDDANELVFQIGMANNAMKRVHFHQGSAIELNNRAKHAVFNQWQNERVHVIFDYLEIQDAGVNASFITRSLTLEHRVFQARRVITVLEPGEPVPAGLIDDNENVEGDGDESVATIATRFTSLSEFEGKSEVASLSTDSRKRIVMELYKLLLEPEEVPGGVDQESEGAPCERTRRDIGQTFRRYTTGEMKENDYLTCLEYMFGRDKVALLFEEEVGLLRLIDDRERRQALVNAFATRDEQQIDGDEDYIIDNNTHTEISEETRLSFPRFLVLGVMKCGTTSLYDLLCQHPLIARCRSKEPHFFDWKWELMTQIKLNATQHTQATEFFSCLPGGVGGVAEPTNVRSFSSCSGSKHEEIDAQAMRLKYAHVFPLTELTQDRMKCSGEATPSYLLGGRALARRVKAVSPHARFVVILRDPAKRAHSHYQMTTDPVGTPEQKKRRGFVDGKTLEELLDEDWAELSAANITPTSDVEDFDSKIMSDRPQTHGSHSYVSRGLYALQLEAWFKEFPRDRFLILRLERDLNTPARTQETVNKVWAFLGLPPHQLSDTKPKNARQYNGLESDIERKLRDFYSPHNDRLSTLLGEDFSDWNEHKE